MEKDLLSNDFGLYTILQGKIHYEKHSHLNNRRGFILEDTSSEFYNYKPFNQTCNLISLNFSQMPQTHNSNHMRLWFIQIRSFQYNKKFEASD